MATHRPTDFGSFIGQLSVCEMLSVSIDAAKRRRTALDHVLFSGPAGLGKTTLCNIIVNSMGGTLFQTNGGVIKSPKDLIGSLVRLREGDFLFIDEIHRIPMVVEEYLYTAMEDYAIDTLASNGVAIRISLNPFTLLGATTREGMLSDPLLHRFGILCRLVVYDVDDLVKIILRDCNKRSSAITYNAAKFIADRSRGTPRIALQLLRRTFDYSHGQIDLDSAKVAMTSLGIREMGLTEKDISVLRALANAKNPMGLGTISLMANEQGETLENVIEPHLLRCGLIERTPRGRIITADGRAYLGRNI